MASSACFTADLNHPILLGDSERNSATLTADQKLQIYEGRLEGRYRYFYTFATVALYVVVFTLGVHLLYYGFVYEGRRSYGNKRSYSNMHATGFGLLSLATIGVMFALHYLIGYGDQRYETVKDAYNMLLTLFCVAAVLLFFQMFMSFHPNHNATRVVPVPLLLFVYVPFVVTGALYLYAINSDSTFIECQYGDTYFSTFTLEA